MSKATLILASSALVLAACTSNLPRLTTMADSPQGGAPARAAAKPPTAAQLAAVNVTVPSPKELMGKGPGDLRKTLGTPSLLRKEGDAQVWQYAGTSCVVFLYLYDNAAGKPEVSYLDARAKSDGAVEVAPCLDDVVRTRALTGES